MGTEQEDRLEGRVSVHPRGFGFVVGTDERGAELSAFVPPPDLNRFLADDLVRADVETAPPASAGGEPKRTAKRLTLVLRRRTTLFGDVVRRGGNVFLRIDRTVANTDWPLVGADDVVDGAKVLARIEERGATAGTAGPSWVAVRTDVLSGKDAEIAQLLVRHDLRGEHAPDVVDAAAKTITGAAGAGTSAPPTTAASSVPPFAMDARRDLRAHVCVTIDGPSTRDIDDALLAFPPDSDGAVRVIVAIADVSAVVEENGVVDLDARARATSVYLPGRTLPMIPRVLSEDRLSLTEASERGVLTAELRIDPEGHVTALDVHEAIIRSTARLTYSAVAKFLDDDDGSAVPAATHETLRLLRTAAARLSQARAQRGGKDVEREEISVSVDEEGDPISVETRRNDVAHVLVERLMVAANEAVARFLVERGLPGIYRVHDAPTLERTRALADASAALGVIAGFSTSQPLSPRALAAFDRQFRGTRHEHAIETAMRRLLGPARYTTKPSPHFGLAAPLYLHFTSPIRRYADLAVHRVLRRYLRGERLISVEQLGFDALCEHLNDQARRAARAETERERVLLARLFAQRIGQVFKGVVVGNKPQGALVQVDGAVALLPGEQRPLGAALDVVVAGVDEELGRIDVRLR